MLVASVCKGRVCATRPSEPPAALVIASFSQSSELILGCRIEPASGYRQAFDRLKDGENPDLFVTDLNLDAGHSGWPLAETFLNKSSNGHAALAARNSLREQVSKPTIATPTDLCSSTDFNSAPRGYADPGFTMRKWYRSHRNQTAGISARALKLIVCLYRIGNQKAGSEYHSHIVENNRSFAPPAREMTVW